MTTLPSAINPNTVSFNRQKINLILGSQKKLKNVKDSGELLVILADHNFLPKDTKGYESYLCELGYYYISGYRRVFLDSYNTKSWAGKFDNGVSEDMVYKLVGFDKEIADILVRNINIAERRIKSRSAFFLSRKISEDCYLNKANFKNSNNPNVISFWEKFIYENYKKVLQNGVRESNPIIRHHIRSYDAKLPIWVLFEHITFGDFIKFMENLVNSIKISTFEDIFDSDKTQYRVLEYMNKDVILEMFTIVKLVRNRLAHLGRIYDWNFHYAIKCKSFTPKYSSLFNPTKDDYNLHDIVDIIGFFILKKDYISLSTDIESVVSRIKLEIPSPFSDRIISLMGYR